MNSKFKNMKNIKYIAGYFLLLMTLVSCTEDTYEFGDLIAPANLQVSYEIVGSDVDPLGDGSGLVNFKITAENVLSYRLVYADQEIEVPGGEIELAFDSEKGMEGPNGGQLFQVIAIVYGVGGASSSKVLEIEVKGFVFPPKILEDFEGDEPAFLTFGPDNHHMAIVDNPVPGGINTSSKVVEYTKPTGSEGWAGINLTVDGIDLETYNKFSLKVYSSKDNIDMVLKVETPAGNVDPKYEITSKITNKNEWTEIFFDFSDAPEGGYSNVILFFDTWNSGDDSTYYYDDIKLSK